jgi:hypothetical protein
VGATVNHAPYDSLLKAHVVKGLVDYDAFERAPTFKRYLASLERVNTATLDEDEQIAFWLNVYNAYTIALINEHHERRSIRNINRTFGVLQLKGPWNERLVKAGGRQLTLDEVEHRILRKQFREPRIHFALVSASKGSPPLRSEAYTGAKLADQLWDQGHIFLRERPDLNRWERNGLSLSMIFTAYRDDFGSSHKEIGLFLAPWFDGEPRAKLDSGRYFRRQLPFDWSLNIQPKTGAK